MSRAPECASLFGAHREGFRDFISESYRRLRHLSGISRRSSIPYESTNSLPSPHARASCTSLQVVLVSLHYIEDSRIPQQHHSHFSRHQFLVSYCTFAISHLSGHFCRQLLRTIIAEHPRRRFLHFGDIHKACRPSSIIFLSFQSQAITTACERAFDIRHLLFFDKLAHPQCRANSNSSPTLVSHLADSQTVTSTI